MDYRGVAKGRMVELEDDISLPEGTAVTVVVEETARGTPATVLRVMRSLPDLQAGDVDELERMIEAGKLPTRSEGLFDAGRAPCAG
jgi:hypothetical protein